MEYRLTYEQQPTTVICFSLTDEHLDPDTITKALGVQPDRAWSKGDQRGRRMDPPTENRLPRHTFGGWELNASCSPYDEFEDQLEQLLNQIEALPDAVHDYILRYDGILIVGYSSAEVSLGFYLSPQSIQRMAALKLSIVFDIYPVTRDDDDDDD